MQQLPENGCNRGTCTEIRYLEIFMNRETWKIYFSDLIYVETQNRKLIIHTTAGEYTTYLTLSKLQQVLPEKEFVQISRFEVISLRKVKVINSQAVILQGGTALQISFRYAEHVLKTYADFISRGEEAPVVLKTRAADQKNLTQLPVRKTKMECV